MASKTILTGIKPTGKVHFGNYLGAIRPALDLANNENINEKSVFFIADYHALTTIKDKDKLDFYTRSVAASWIALGLDAQKTLIFRQSDIPEIFELNWILSCLTSKGLMNRAHAYNAKVAENEKNNKDTDYNVNMGLFSYPILMSADILLFGTDIVPVGRDQIQHVEIARDIADSFNNLYGKTLKIPEYSINDAVAAIQGNDGRKMSKSYNNTLFVFEESSKMKKYIMKMKTDSSGSLEPKKTENSEIFQLYKQFATENEIYEMEQSYINGIGWGGCEKIIV